MGYCVTLTDLRNAEAVAALIVALEAAHGLDLSPYEESFLLKSVDRRLQATGLGCVAAYREHVVSDRAEAEVLRDSLRIAYTDFFRDPVAFALLEKQVLPALFAGKEQRGKRSLRVWSAGCATGQEAWSLALLLDELSGGRDQPFSYRIFATDLPGPALAQAASGVYPAEAVGNVRLRHLRGYFSPQGDSYAIVPRLRERVDFSTYDLLDEGSTSPTASIYGDFDLVLCCNLLFYYRPAVRQQVLDKLCRALAPGGYLVTGEAERDMVARQDGLQAVVPLSPVFQIRGRA